MLRLKSGTPPGSEARLVYERYRSSPNGDVFVGSVPHIAGKKLEEIPLHNALPQVDFFRGTIYKTLRKEFKARITHNYECLEQAMINRHFFDHMDTVANGVYGMSVRLGVPRDEQLTVTLPTRFHDNGYIFGKKEDAFKQGKETHSRHAETGAVLFVETLEGLIKKGQVTMPDWWTDKHVDMAYAAIRLHSNGSAVSADEQESTPVAALLPGLIDKLDNTHSRVYDSHIQAFSRIPFLKPGHFNRVIQNPLDILKYKKPANKHHGKDAQDVFADIERVNHTFQHRIVPKAITHQAAGFERETGNVYVQYTAEPAIVGQALAINYTPEQHANHFDEAYTKSLRTASDIVRIIRRKVFEMESPEGEPVLHVQLQYNDEKPPVTRSY